MHRLTVLSIGITGNYIIDCAFDYLLYPLVIWKLGVLKGGVIMTFLSFLACYLEFLFYGRVKKDWLGIEAIKGMRGYSGNSKTARFVSWIMKKGDLGAMFFLSIYSGPHITTIYMRHGANQFNGLNRRDWRIFLSSTVIANVYWTIVAFAGVEAVEYVWDAAVK